MLRHSTGERYRIAAFIAALFGLQFCRLFKFKPVLESFSDSFSDHIITVGIWIKCDSFYLGNIHLVAVHDFLISDNVYDLADDPYTIFIMLVLNEFALQTYREFINYRSIHLVGLSNGQAALLEFSGIVVS